VIQNNLLFLGAKLLPTVVYVVCTQTKILATTLMSRLILGTRINSVQYISLFFLGSGIFLVQQTEDKSASTSQEGSMASKFVGMIAVFLASFTSGIAGIVLEKIYKGVKGPDRHDPNLDKNDVKYTIWIRNVQLSLISLPFALMGAVSQFDNSSTTQGLMKGFDGYVWGIVVCQAAGGIIIAFVMKFANNILKCLAVAISICLCALYSVAMGSLAVTSSLVSGLMVVVASVYAFSMSPTATVSNRCSLPK